MTKMSRLPLQRTWLELGDRCKVAQPKYVYLHSRTLSGTDAETIPNASRTTISSFAFQPTRNGRDLTPENTERSIALLYEEYERWCCCVESKKCGEGFTPPKLARNEGYMSNKRLITLTRQVSLAGKTLSYTCRVVECQFTKPRPSSIAMAQL